MAAQYPWFKFFPSEWMMGRIQRQTPSAQVAFIRLCCKYWHNECELTEEEAELECGHDEYYSLLRNKLFIKEDFFIKIKFLDEQMVENNQFRELQSYRGKCSAAAKKAKKESSTTVQPDSTTVQPPFNTGSVLVQPDSTIKNIEYRIENKNTTNSVSVGKPTTIKKSLKEKEVEFGKSLTPYVTIYGKEMIREFFDHWTEPNHNKTLMRFEKEKTWDVSRRLAKWNRNDFAKTTRQQKTNATRIEEGTEL